MAEGIVRNNALGTEDAHQTPYNAPEPFFTYTRDDRELLPVMEKTEQISEPEENTVHRLEEEDPEQEYSVPIRKIRPTTSYVHPANRRSESALSGRVRIPRKTIHYGTFRGLAA